MDEEKNTEQVTENTNAEVKSERKGFNITSMILGIISTLTFCWWYISLPTGIIAIIFSVAGKKDAGRGMGIAGMVLGIVGLVLCILVFVLALIGIAAIGSGLTANTLY